MDLKTIGKELYSRIRQHSPEILTGIGIAGMVTTVALAVKATPKAMILIEEEKKKQNTDELAPVDVIKASWMCYIPTSVSLIMTSACFIGSTSVNNRRNAALATAYSLSEQALKTYQEKVIETIGENKEQRIRDEIAKDKLKAHPVQEVIFTNAGTTLCFDSFRQRYFDGDIEKIRKLEAQLNRELYSSMFVSLNEYYYGLGLSPVPDGDDVGWNIDDGPIEFEYSSQLAPNDAPCLVISYRIQPRFDFRSLH